MCRMSASLQFSDFACAASVPIVNSLSNELRQWALIHQAVKNSLHAQLGNNPLLLANVKAGNNIIRQLCNEMQSNTQRWVADENPKQRLQLGGILYYRFYEFMAHSLLHMNHCETIITWFKQLYSEKVMDDIYYSFTCSSTIVEWIRRNDQLMDAVNSKDRLRWSRFLQAHFSALK